MLINAYSLFFLNNFEENNENKFGFTKTIRLLMLNFCESIVNHIIEIMSS